MLSPADAETEVPSAKNPVTESVDGGCFGHGQAGKQAVQILLGAKHRGKLRLYRYLLVPSMEGY